MKLLCIFTVQRRYSIANHTTPELAMNFLSVLKIHNGDKTMYILFLFYAYLILFSNSLNEEPQVIDFRSSLCSNSGMIGLFFPCFFPHLTVFDWITNILNATFLGPVYFWTFINISKLYSGHSKLLRSSLISFCFCLSSVLQKQCDRYSF